MVLVKPLAEKFALGQLLLANSALDIVKPQRYFKASNELVVLTLVVCWAVTLCYDWRQAYHHPARMMVGHLNPCFGWDYAPASYIAIFACAADVYLAWTYATLEQMRTHLRNYDGRIGWPERFSLATTYLHGVASMLWMLLWVVGPQDGRWASHLGFFAAAIVFRYLCTLGNFVECYWSEAGARLIVERKHKVFIVVYGVATTLLPMVYFTNVAVYRSEGREGRDPLIPWQVSQALDVLWVACLASSSRLSVAEPPILVTRRVLEFGDEVAVDDLSEKQIEQLKKMGIHSRHEHQRHAP